MKNMTIEVQGPAAIIDVPVDAMGWGLCHARGATVAARRLAHAVAKAAVEPSADKATADVFRVLSAIKGHVAPGGRTKELAEELVSEARGESVVFDDTECCRECGSMRTREMRTSIGPVTHCGDCAAEWGPGATIWGDGSW